MKSSNQQIENQLQFGMEIDFSICQRLQFHNSNSIQQKNMEKYFWRRAQISGKSQSQPIPRWGHNCCVIGQQVVFFGGYADSNYMNDVWSYNTVSMQWKEIKTTGDIPTNRSNCSMNYDKQNNRVIVFGGGGPNKKRFNSINILDWKTKDWLEIVPKQNQPAPWQRTYHSAELVYPYLVVFGGQGVADMDDLWIFNFITLSWQQVPIDKSMPKPCARRFHSSALVGNQFFVIAGCHAKYRPLNDVYSLDLTPLIESGKLEHLEWKKRQFKGSAFLTRWGQSSSVYDNKIYIFGGRFSSDLNDILVIDLQKQTMKSVKTGSQIPKARRRHSACFIGSCMVIFGGFNGQYFNDLYYINLFELKSKLIVPSNNKNLLNEKFVENNHLSDGQILTSELEKFPIHKGLISNSFTHPDKMEEFLKQIDGMYTKEELKELMMNLYRGYGEIKTQYEIKYEIQLANSQNQKDIQQYRKIVSIVEEQLHKSNRKTTNASSVICLSDQRFSDFLQNQRNPKFYDLTIVINKSYEMKVNRAILALSSTYFANLLSDRYQDLSEVKGKISLSMNENCVIIFEILINYLLLNYVVVPESMSYKEWVQLCGMAQMFCLGRLVSICQQQLCYKVNEDNFLDMMNIAIDLQLDILALWCADYQIKLMITKEEVYQHLLSQPLQMKAKKQFVLKMVYELLRFDILQVRLQRQNNLDRGLQKKQSSSTASSEKQNYQINYNQ